MSELAEWEQTSPRDATPEQRRAWASAMNYERRAQGEVTYTADEVAKGNAVLRPRSDPALAILDGLDVEFGRGDVKVIQPEGWTPPARWMLVTSGYAAAASAVTRSFHQFAVDIQKADDAFQRLLDALAMDVPEWSSMEEAHVEMTPRQRALARKQRPATCPTHGATRGGLCRKCRR